MSKVGQHIIEVEEYVDALLDEKKGTCAILADVHKKYGFFGQDIAKDYLNRADGFSEEPDYEPV